MHVSPEDLQKAQRHVDEGKARVAEQAKRVQQLANTGQDTKEARKLLALLERTLAAMEEHYKTERQLGTQPGAGQQS